jgi:release factor glutamine methyltransferase
MPEQERWTIGRLLQWTADYLKQHGSSSPRLDAEVLLATARNCQRIQLYTAFEEEPAEGERSKFRELVKRRAAGEPVAYLVGHREFFSLPFFVTNAVLIPRPETEFVVIAMLDAIKEWGPRDDRPVQVVDLGTGSGAIAISVARHAPRSQLTAIDISPTALEVARQNAAQLGVSDRIEFVESDLFANVPAGRKFDIVGSNPPYVAENEFELLSRESRQYEPRQALVAGPGGLEVIAPLVEQASDRLNSGGWLIFEISPMIESAARSLVEQNARFAEVKTVKDLAGLARVIVARRKGE